MVDYASVWKLGIPEMAVLAGAVVISHRILG